MHLGDNFLFLSTGSLLTSAKQSTTVKSGLEVKILDGKKESHQSGHKCISG